MTRNNSRDDNSNLPWWARNTSKKVYSASEIRKYDAGTIVAALIVVLLLFAALAWTTIGINPIVARNSTYESVEHPASVDAVIAQCGNIFSFSPPEEDYGVIDYDKLTPSENGDITIPRQPMIVPVYGYMAPEELPSRIKTYDIANPPDYEQMMRSLYSGKKIIWFDASVPEETVKEIHNYVMGKPDWIAAAWREERSLPQRRHIAFSSWNVSMSCSTWSTSVADEFLTFVEEHPEYAPEDKNNPPAAIVKEGGKLAPILPQPNPRN